MNKRGFTLAEVLVTLMVIGVVAVLLVKVVQNAQDFQLKQAWRKQYSALNQVYSQIVADNGGSIKGAFPHDNWVPDTQNLLALFRAKMRIAKYCPSINALGSGCWHAFPSAGHDELAVRDKMGTLQSFSGYAYPAVVLSDGTLIYMAGINIDSDVWGMIVVDVNGFKKPNVIGRDIFGALIQNDRLSAWGISNYQNTCNTTGQGCAADYLFK